jgi:chemotaxis response regulator CheB
MSRLTPDIIVIGGSAGALQVVRTVLTALPDGFPAAVFVSLHRHPAVGEPDWVSHTLSVASLRVHLARDQQAITFGEVYVAPPNEHMAIENGVIRVETSPKEQQFRPCINVLFKSAATAYGRRVIGVLLSGAFGNDGAAGLWQIRHRGGITIVQDPRDAAHPAMPQEAIHDVAVTHILPHAQIGPKLIELTRETPGSATAPRILIVEDESVVATNLQHSLIDMGYDAFDWVPTAEAAIEIAGRELPDLVLMDIHLGGAQTGIEAARTIWETLQIPIVYCTAHADPDTLKAVQTTESYGYIVKPFQSDAVRAVVQLALARREKELR